MPTITSTIMTLNTSRFVVGVAILLVSQQEADAYAAWFVDRRASCFTPLVPDEIVMNNKITHHSNSREPGIHLDISPLEGNQPASEYSVKFVMPSDAKVQDVQYVLQLSDPDDPEAAELPARFTSAPTNGGIGCRGSRAHGRARMEDSPAIVTFNDDIKEGARIAIWAGWATGHETVTLTDKVVIVASHGVEDSVFYDDTIEAELEEEDIEEEREEIEKEIEFAEEDAVEALEEKRIETEGIGSAINEAEQEVVEALEANRKDMNKALNRLKDEIILKQKAHALEQKEKHHDTKIDEAKLKEAWKKHHEKHPHLEDMERRFKDAADPRKEMLRDVLDIKFNLEESIEKLKKEDMREHSNAKKSHIKPLPKEELKIDMEEIKRKVKQKLSVEKLKETLGVHELFNSEDMKMLRGKLKEGIPHGGESVYHAEKGVPLPPEGKHFLIVMFSFFIIVGFARWFLDKRRRTKRDKRRE